MKRSLWDWEKWLEQVFPRIDLLGEIPITQVEFEGLADVIHHLIQRAESVYEATRTLLQDYPLTLITFMAHFAARNTRRDFWAALGDLIGASDTELNNADWRQIFFDVLDANHKPKFENVGGVTNRFVTSMRVHGGIPVYSLYDFFENMLLPSIEKPEYKTLAGEELRDALLNRSAIQIFSDSIITNYFKTTGEIGLGFLDKCQEMARTYKEEQLIPGDIDLPAHVKDAYLDFMEIRQDEKAHLKKPRLIFDDEEGILLDLPEEALSGENLREILEVYWQVITDVRPEPRIETVRLMRKGRDVLTEGRQIPLRPTSRVKVSFHGRLDAGHSTQFRNWVLPLVPEIGAPPLLTFRASDSSLITQGKSLPAAEVLLLYPQDVSLKVDGESKVLHEFGTLSGYWNNWQAEFWKLQLGTMRLFHQDQEIAFLSIQGQSGEPELIGAEPYEYNLDPKETPLYVGGIPRLRIPIRAAASGSINRWRVELNSSWDTSQPVRVDSSLDKLVDYIYQDDDYLELDLSGLLGEKPIGTYSLHITNHTDVNRDFKMRFWDQLEIEGMPSIILPDDGSCDEDNSLELIFKLPPRSTLETQAGTTGIQVLGTEGNYTVLVEDCTNRADLLLIRQQGEQSIQVPLFVPIPRLEWRLAMGDEQAVEWSVKPIKRSLDAYLQAIDISQVASLQVRMNQIDRIANQLVVSLVDSRNPEIELQSDFKQTQSVMGKGHVRFAISGYDVLRGKLDVSVFEFLLKIPDPITWTYHKTPILVLTRSLEISNVRIDSSNGQRVLTWDEPHPLKNRRVFIRSPWQPWEKGWDIRIPDDCQGKFDLLEAGYALPELQYEAYFYVAADWEPSLDAPPHQDCHMLEMVTTVDHLLWLEKRIQRDPDHAFRWYFEKASIHSGLGNLLERDTSISNCFQNLDQAPLNLTLALYYWLKDKDPNSHKAVRMRMFHANYMERFFAETQAGDWIRDHYLRELVTYKNLSPDTAIVLLQHTEDPQVIQKSLDTLIQYRRPEGVKSIVSLVNNGKLNDHDALDILYRDFNFCYGVLLTEASSIDGYRLLSGLIKLGTDFEDIVDDLDDFENEILLAMIKAEPDIQLIRSYIGELIRRNEKNGIDIVMELFNQGRLLGGEVTETLGKNPKFSYETLMKKSKDHAIQVQLNELIRKYPSAFGFISPGLFVNTPGGWGKILSIRDPQGNILENCKKDEPVIYELEMHPLEHPEPAELDMHKERLTFPKTDSVYRCSKCNNYISATDKHLKQHYRFMHGGIGLAFSQISPSIPVIQELEFSDEIITEE